MRWIETDTNTNINLATGTSVGSYTADADRLIICDVFIDQAQGSGTYTAWVTQQVNGAGSSYLVGPKTEIAALVGETALKYQSGFIVVRSGDVLTVFVDGLAGDTTTPDTIVRWCEMAALRPTVAGRTLDVSATGEAGVDWGNVGSPTTAVDLTNTTIKSLQDGYVNVTGTVNANIVSSANIDFTALQKTSLDAATPASVGSVTNAVTVGTNNDKTGYTLSAAGIAAILATAIEGTVTIQQWMRRVAAVLFGKSTGGGAAGSKKFRDLGDAVNRVDATSDANGNRSAVSFDDT